MLEQIQRVAVILSLLSLATLFVGILFAQAWQTLKKNLPRSVLAVFVIAAVAATVQAQKIKYVDANARGRQDGNDWANAYREISTAVEACARAQMDGIVYVRPGTYGSVWRDNSSYFEEGWLYPIDVYAVEGPSMPSKARPRRLSQEMELGLAAACIRRILLRLTIGR